MTHTKGPWMLFVGNCGDIIEIQDARGKPIVGWGGFDDSRRSYEEHLANARLIASAPELLKVVELLINDTADLDIVIDMGREAIRKASR